MGFVRGLIGVGMPLLLSGCLTTSLYPLFTEEDLVFDPALVGTWSAGEEMWTFAAQEDKAYQLTILEAGESVELTAHLVQLGDHRFLDLYPMEADCKNCWYYVHTVPVHTFSQIALHGDVLELVFMGGEWLKKKSEAGELGIAHHLRDDQVFLSASTEAIQGFVMTHLEQVFDVKESEAFHRLGSDIPTIRAARDGKADRLKTLLAAGGRIEERDGAGHTPLVWAARAGHIEVVQLLLDGGAALEATDHAGRTPLVWAGRNGHNNLVQLLLKAGADIEVRDSGGHTALIWAARNGQSEVIHTLVEAGADIAARDGAGLTPLLWAARNGHNGLVDILTPGKAP